MDLLTLKKNTDMKTIGQLIEFGGWPVVMLLLTYPLGVYKLMEIVGNWLYPIDD